MNTSIWPMWVVVLAFVVLSAVLLSGRGSFLIAGYNTSSKEAKANYNEKKLCRVVGGGLGGVTVIVGVFTWYQFSVPAAINWLVPWGLFATIAATIILANTVCNTNLP